MKAYAKAFDYFSSFAELTEMGCRVEIKFGVNDVEVDVMNTFCDLLNPQTGHLEKQVILSVKIPRQTLDTLNLERIDPSDSMRNFLHNMKFRKTSGFEVVERVVFGNN